jgi:hypothetical protein
MLWLVLLSASQPAEGQNRITGKVESWRVIDICGQKTDQVIVVINLGKIVRQDSLFGCNFQLSYDSTKLKFHSALYLNTLAEFFDFRQVGFYKGGRIIGAVATLSMFPIYGDRPLVGFLGTYTGNCSDSIEIKIDYLEFTFEFKKIVDYQNGFVVGNVADQPSRLLKLKPTADSTIIDSLSSNGKFSIMAETMNDSTVNVLKARLACKKFNNYMLGSINPVDTNLIKVSYEAITEDTVDLTFFVKGRINKKEIAEINIAEKRKGEEVAEISLIPYETDDCSCISRFSGGKHYIRSESKREVDTTGSEISEAINEDFKERFINSENEWEIDSQKDIDVNVYDMLGNRVISQKITAGVSRISLNRFSEGVYFGEIIAEKQRIIRKILIKKLIY